MTKMCDNHVGIIVEGGGGTLKYPLRTFRVSDPGGGAILPAKFMPPPGFFQTRPKIDARPARKQKNLLLHS
jgi:hypothetical protein